MCGDRYRELGVELDLVPSDDGMTVPLERMLAAIDERTAIVPISHGIYVSGALQDVKAITARAHEVGALVMVDVYQTVGVMPIDVHEWGRRHRRRRQPQVAVRRPRHPPSCG
jgi:kynureninase